MAIGVLAPGKGKGEGRGSRRSPPPPPRPSEGCCPSEEELAAYAEGSALAGPRQAVEDHLAVCDVCRRLVADLALTLLPGEPPRISPLPAPEGFWGRVHLLLRGLSPASAFALLAVTVAATAAPAALLLLREPSRTESLPPAPVAPSSPPSSRPPDIRRDALPSGPVAPFPGGAEAPATHGVLRAAPRPGTSPGETWGTPKPPPSPAPSPPPRPVAAPPAAAAPSPAGLAVRPEVGADPSPVRRAVPPLRPDGRDLPEAEALFIEALVHYQHGRHRQALDTLDGALRAGPDPAFAETIARWKRRIAAESLPDCRPGFSLERVVRDNTVIERCVLP